MKKLFVVCSWVVVMMACETKKPDAQQERTTPKKTTQAIADLPNSATSAKNWMQFVTPSEVHQALAKTDGTWNCETSFWQYPGAAEMKGGGKMVSKMILNGLYQEGIFTGTMMGQAFEGRSITGYDNLQHKMVSTWIDNMGSGIMFLTGPYDQAKRVATLTGVMTDPSSGAEVRVKEVLKTIDDNTQEMDMFGFTPDGKEFKSMHMVYTRVK